MDNEKNTDKIEDKKEIPAEELHQEEHHEHHHEHHHGEGHEGHHEHHHEHHHEDGQEEHHHKGHKHSGKHSGSSRYSLCENMFILFMITFAAGVLCYEKSMPESFTQLYKTAVFIICLFMWISLSLISGARNKWGFMVFTALFWFLPIIEIYLSNNGPEICRMSIVMYVLSEFFNIMFITPAGEIGELFKIGAVPVVIITALLSMFAFLAGNLFSDKLKKGNYTF